AGMSAAAQIAAAQGYKVSGCDLQTNTPYLAKIEKLGAKISVGHSVNHLKGIDLLAVTPAAFFQSAQHPELVEAEKRKILLTWQQFMGKYLHARKEVICIAGAHGKSTTTSLVGLLLEAARLDPTVEVGATVSAWNNNVRLGKGQYFVSEADEYYHNFLAYHPQIIVLTMIEMDHPEYFGTFKKILDAYRQFVNQLKPNGILIYNADDTGIQKLVRSLSLPIKLVPYSVAEFPNHLKLGIPGVHNRTNAMAVIKLAKLLKIDSRITHQVLADFKGIGRRLELIGQKHGVKVFDDYANHPTSYAATLQAVREEHPQVRIWAVIEPHTFSRPRTTLSNYPEAFKAAHQVIISKIFPSREKDPGNFTGAEIANGTGSKAKYIAEFGDIANHLKQHVQPKDIILVMGSGNSYQLARIILATL
ncbi:MAG: cyanophycin synthetase, partial [bacterium]|nr:cyanophycin synthetase [bacterium]